MKLLQSLTVIDYMWLFALLHQVIILFIICSKLICSSDKQFWNTKVYRYRSNIVLLQLFCLYLKLMAYVFNKIDRFKYKDLVSEGLLSLGLLILLSRFTSC